MREIGDSSVSRFLSETMGGFVLSVNPLIDGVRQVGLRLSAVRLVCQALGRRWRQRLDAAKGIPRRPDGPVALLKEIRNG